MKVLFILSILGFATSTIGHRGKDHSKAKKSDPVATKQLQSNYVRINKEYIQDVKPVFKRSCFDCHGSTTRYPWYHKVPGIKYIINQDIVEAKEHLDFSNDFPFQSHETPLNDLSAIEESVKSGSMPPVSYRLMHRDSKLSKKEIEKIKNWIKNARETLK